MICLDIDAATIIDVLNYFLCFRWFRFFVAALGLSSWWIMMVNMGLRPPLFISKRHSRGTLWYDLLQRSIAVSAAVAPVAIHWGLGIIASLSGGFVDNSWFP